MNTATSGTSSRQSAKLYDAYSYESLHGRYAHWPAASAAAKRTFLIVYGQHATLERIRPIAEALRQYGEVYAVDNPGFGGMQPAHVIGRYPDLPFFAGHLHYFITTHIPSDRKVTLLGISYGFQMITELLQRYPDIHARTEDVLSFVGFVSPDDFKMPLRYRIFLQYFLANMSRTRSGARVMQLMVRRPLVKGVYTAVKPFNVKFKHLSRQEARQYIDEQINLWLVNDRRTHGVTAWDITTKNDQRSYRIPLDVIHIGVPKDHLLDNAKIIQELKTVYADARAYNLNLDNHAPLDIGTPEAVEALLPVRLKQHLAQSKNRRSGQV